MYTSQSLQRSFRSPAGSAGAALGLFIFGFSLISIYVTAVEIG
jgi:hypothetical protein